LIVGWLLLCTAYSADLQDRAVRHFHTAHGLPVPGTVQLVEGSDGFLWVSHQAGVSRFDGERFVSMPDIDPRGGVSSITPRAAGGVWGVDRSGLIWVLSPSGTRPLPMPTDRVADVGVDADGSLLAVDFEGRLWKRSADRWSQPLTELLLPDERVVRILEEAESVLMTTRGAIRLTHSGPQRASLLPPMPDITALALEPDGWTWAAHDGRVTLFDDRGEVAHEWPTQKRAFNIERRSGVVWVAANDRLGRLSRDGSGTWSEVDWAGALFVDRENALWMTGPRGITVWPEPETRVVPVTEAGQHFRFLSATPEGIWGSTWFNATHTDDRLQPALALPAALMTQGRFCVDGLGRVRTLAHDKQSKQMYVATVAPLPALMPVDVPSWYAQCAEDRDGSIWFGVLVGPDGLLRAGPDDSIEEFPVPDEMGVYAVSTDPDGRLWVGHHERVCWVDSTELRAGEARWRCADVPGGRSVDVLSPQSNGRMWAGTDYRGVVAIDPEDGSVSDLDTLNTHLRVPNVADIRPSPRGGHWVVGKGGIIRVGVDGTLLEELGGWNGIEVNVAGSIAEEADGDVWIANSLGLTRVPASARSPTRPVPEVSLLSIRVDGVDTPIQGAIGVPAPPNRVALQFMANSYRAPHDIRYAVRFLGRSEPTSPTESGSVELVDLPSGVHSISVTASLDGTSWSSPATVELRVALPWWRQPWVLFLALCGLAGLSYAAYRTRVAILLARERERLRIAMDLHDEIGSGLGSIRILSSLIGRDDVGSDTRKDLASRVEQTAGELHGSLQGLVGTLRPRGTRVGSLIDALRNRCSMLFADSDIKVTIWSDPTAESIDLPLAIRSDVERLASEALHNVARHSGASTVSVTLDRVGSRLVLTLTDDGCGFDLTAERKGLGVESMIRRAEAMGATLQIVSNDRGTRISLSFPVRAGWTPTQN